jgi:hypothetical protein
MTRFYLHIREGDALLEDLEGQDFVSLAAAKNEAVAAAREIMSERIRRGEPPNRSSFEIRDKDGQLVLTLPFQEALAGR